MDSQRLKQQYIDNLIAQHDLSESQASEARALFEIAYSRRSSFYSNSMIVVYDDDEYPRFSLVIRDARAPDSATT